MSVRTCPAAHWLSDVYRTQVPGSPPAADAGLLRHVAGLVACFLGLLAVLAVAGITLAR